jgi:hypothetical protein
MKLRLGLLLNLIMLMIVGPVYADRQYPLEFRRGPTQLQQPVEQWTPGGMTQPDHTKWVWNRTGFVWDPDDDDRLSGYGYLDANSKAVGSVGLMADMDAHATIVKVYAPASVVTILRYDYGKTSLREFKLTGSGVICVDGPDYATWSPSLQVIESSRSQDGLNVGKAVPLTVRVLIENPTNKRIRNIGVDVFIQPTFVPAESLGCPARPWPRDGFDPMWWSTIN